jgi:hypothetical protein
MGSFDRSASRCEKRSLESRIWNPRDPHSYCFSIRRVLMEQGAFGWTQPLWLDWKDGELLGLLSEVTFLPFTVDMLRWGQEKAYMGMHGGTDNLLWSLGSGKLESTDQAHLVCPWLRALCTKTLAIKTARDI